MPARLPVRPRPYGGELLTSWLMRLAHANVQRLPYFTSTVTGDANFWTHDADRHLRPEIAANLTEVTGVSREEIAGLTLQVFSGTVFHGLLPRTLPRWVLPLHKRGYQRARPGLLYCPDCLGDALYLRQVWRLSFMTVCPVHGRLLRDACPRCAAPYAPQCNDLGRGVDWSIYPEPPFGLCATCGEDLRAQSGEEALEPLIGLQARLQAALDTGVMVFGDLSVPALEGFDVLHQLLAVTWQPDMAAYLVGTGGHEVLGSPPERRNRSFEDHTLADRRRLLLRLASLTEAWPNRLLTACEAAQVYRRPLMVNFLNPPAWYEAVAQQVSRANGRRPYRHTPLVAHLTQAELLRELDVASSSQERRRWEVLCRYATVEEKLPVARALGYPFEFVHRTVTRYNAHGPAAMRDARQGQVNLGGRVLAPELERNLRAALEVTPMTYAQMADWVEKRTGHRPAPSTLWMYKRGVQSHSREGRRAGK